jgi:TRAP-type C4-dicarboxylate transport system permease small subunit
MRDRRTSVVISAYLLAVVALCFLAWAILHVVTAAITPPDYTHAAAIAWHFLAFTLSIAGLTTAFVQIARTLIPFRGEFHYQSLSLWFEESATSLLTSDTDINAELLFRMFQVHPAEQPSNLPEVSQVVKDAHAAFETGQPFDQKSSDKDPIPDLYDLPLEQLTAQLSLRIDSALDAPYPSTAFLLCVYGTQGTDQLLQLLEPPLASSRAMYSDTENEREALRKAEARASLSRLGQFKVDAFQIATGSLWRRRLRLWVTAVSLAASLVLTFASTWYSTPDRYPDRFADHSKGWSLALSILVYSVLAGFIASYIAMLFRDLTAIIENKRR